MTAWHAIGRWPLAPRIVLIVPLAGAVIVGSVAAWHHAGGGAALPFWAGTARALQIGVTLHGLLELFGLGPVAQARKRGDARPAIPSVEPTLPSRVGNHRSR